MFIVNLLELGYVLHTRPSQGVQGCLADRAGNGSNDICHPQLFFSSSDLEGALFSLAFDDKIRMYYTLRGEEIT